MVQIVFTDCTVVSVSKRAINRILISELSQPVLTTKVCRGLDSKTQHSACGAHALTHYATDAALMDIDIHVFS